MIRVPDDALTDYPQRARDDLTAAWEQLVGAAEHGAKQIGRSSRRRSAITRKRTVRAGRALRGESPAPWRWFGAGLAAGMIAGAAGTIVLARRPRGTDQASPDHPPATARLREQGGAATEAVRERATAVAHGAATSARGTAAKLRKKAGGKEPVEQPNPPTSGSAKPPSATPGE